MSLLHSLETAETVEAPYDGQAVSLPPRRHVLDLDDFSPAEILATLDSTRGMAEVLHRDIKRSPR